MPIYVTLNSMALRKNDVIKEYFFKTKPVFDGFEKFVEAYQRKQLTDK